MNNRADAFVRKFSDAQIYLGSQSIQKIVSLKFRGNVGYSNYRELIDGYLNKEQNIKIEQLLGDFQGNAWLVTDTNDNKVILVEHETGLEILYVLGSIASLLSLIPLIGSAWQHIRTGFMRRPFDINDRNLGLEIRILNSKKEIIEQHAFRIYDYVLAECLKEIAVLKKRINQLEKQISKQDKRKKKLKSPIRSLKKGKK